MSTDRFDARKPDDVISLVDENPLVWIFLEDEDGPFVTAAPVRPVVADSQLHAVIGHVPRASRIAGALKNPRDALILVLGPHGYVSPSWMSDRTQAPTWNFASAQLVVTLRIVDDPAMLHEHLRDLTAAMERHESNSWRVEEMGPRLHRLASRIVPFEAKIVDCDSRFKLGQDENDRTFAEIMQGLARAGNDRLLVWMRAFNSSRG